MNFRVCADLSFCQGVFSVVCFYACDDGQMLATKMKQAHYERKLNFDTSFERYKQAILNKDDKQSFEYLSEICKLYGAKLEYRSAKEILTNNTGKLQW